MSCKRMLEPCPLDLCSIAHFCVTEMHPSRVALCFTFWPSATEAGYWISVRCTCHGKSWLPILGRLLKGRESSWWLEVMDYVLFASIMNSMDVAWSESVERQAYRGWCHILQIQGLTLDAPRVCVTVNPIFPFAHASSVCPCRHANPVNSSLLALLHSIAA